jgi:hypothetical protein
LKQLPIAIVFLLMNLTVIGQEYARFDLLRQKADSATDKLNRALAARYFEEALQLPANEVPAQLSATFYELACAYSTLNKKALALEFLNKSFANSRRQTNRNYLSASHIGSDPDLDNIREEPGFISFLKNYFPGLPVKTFMSQEISYDDLLTLIEYLSLENHSNVISIRGKTIYWKKNNQNNRYGLPFFNGSGLKTKPVFFTKCSFNLNFVWDGAEQAQPDDFFGMQFSNCEFNGRFYWDKVDFITPPRFIDSRFADDLYLTAIIHPTSSDPPYVMSGCSLHFVFVALTAFEPIPINLSSNVSADSADFRIQCNRTSVVQISKNEFARKNIELTFNKVAVLKLTDNIARNLIVTNTEIEAEFDLQRSKISGKLLMDGTYFSNEPANDIDWVDFGSSHLGLLKTFHRTPDFSYRNTGRVMWAKVRSFDTVSGENENNISNSGDFVELMGLYSMFLNLYKNKNDLESYNRCYVAIKEFQSKRLKYLYETNKTFESFFRWKLSQLLKYYVRHGTDPARAIVISIYIISIFGIFFFFFPSDWDVTSKKKLIQNFKDFAQKNDKGYVKPFFILIWGFMISLLNAFTLSLNAFITLGFGNIPTHGAARYVCVLEGFLGWFLLSIFTVALINQVL